MMLGIPIIASDISMNLEAVKNDYSALVYKVRDDEQLLEKMKFCINHYSKMIEMGENARGVAMKNFEINKIAQQFETFLKQKIN